MKVKGINVFEQHLEKMVLGGALLIALGIVGWHVVSTPKAKVGPNEVAFPEVDAALEDDVQHVGAVLVPDARDGAARRVRRGVRRRQLRAQLLEVDARHR
ncbi:MAG: hypothetical protein ACKOFI_12225, partial [Phycisphaerales bacterium]